MSLELWVIVLGVVLMLADFFVAPERRRFLGYLAVATLGTLLITNLSDATTGTAFNNAFVEDTLAIFFKRFFLIAAMLVLFMSVEFSDRIAGGISEYYSLIAFALSGMLFAASANDFAMLFVSIELITITFYVLTSFQRSRLVSLEAGVKYLILGALSSAFLVFGIALVWGTTGKLNFTELASVAAQFETNKIFLIGVLFVLVGIGFKIAAFPFQIWVPDVYQGAPTPTTAFLAVGSKAAGFVLLLRVLFTALPAVTKHWADLLIVISGITILYGNLCALPQRNLKRLLGYSGISHAGYLLLGVAALSVTGQAALLYYLAGYLFTVVAAFLVICVVMRHLDSEDISGLAGLNQRSPLLAAHDDAGYGVAGGHSADGRVLRKIFIAESRHRAGRGQSQPWLLLPRVHGARRRGDFALLLFRRDPRDLLEQERAGFVADPFVRAGQIHGLRLHRRDVLDRPVSERGAQPRHGSSQGPGAVNSRPLLRRCLRFEELSATAARRPTTTNTVRLHASPHPGKLIFAHQLPPPSSTPEYPDLRCTGDSSRFAPVQPARTNGMLVWGL